MAFSNIFKKASNLLGLSGTDSLRPPPLDGEIIYCKNNVCVHPPASLLLDSEHHPGYLTLRAQQNASDRPTLILTWIPNITLKKNPHSIESSPARSRNATPRISPRRNPRQEFSKSDESFTLTPSPSPSTQGSEQTEKKQSYDDSLSLCSETSMGSRDDPPSSATSEGLRENGARLSSSCKSQTDSGIGTEEVHSGKPGCGSCSNGQVMNNEKVPQPSVRPPRVGVHVNDLNSYERETNIHTDDMTAEEQMAAMLNRNKLHSKIKDKDATGVKPVSIEIKGDSLVVVTEQQCDQQSVMDRNINRNESKFETSSSTDLDNTSISSGSNTQSPCGVGATVRSTPDCPVVVNEDGVNLTDGLPDIAPCKPRFLTDLQCQPPPPNTPATMTPDGNIAMTTSKSRTSSGSSETTSGPDSRPATPCSSDGFSEPCSPQRDWDGEATPSSCSSPSALSHNLTFPENAMTSVVHRLRGEKRSAREQLCGVFSVDLGEMRSLRLFYNNAACTQGQVVIASRESQYKILHFHNGGLDKLAEIFEDWSLFAHETTDQNEQVTGERPYRQFLVVKPHISEAQCHPEEHLFPLVNEDVWHSHMTPDGQIEDVFLLRKSIFFGGLEPTMRHEVWPFLLHYYPFASTFEEREAITNDKYIEYQNIRKLRESMDPEAKQQFWRNIQCIVEKDVVRTDRSHHYFKGENNPNIEVLKNILLNYAVANPTMGYTQGMSDLLAPVLAAVQQEPQAYWCFTGLMTRTIFVSSPKDSDMDQQLKYLQELLRVTLPKFHYHLKLLGQDALELLFCHRWILLCFKREFCEADALRIWEACWARYQTDYFHLFVCVAIVAIYGDDIVEQRLPADEILLHFSSLAMHMNGQLVLRKARGLLHEFRKRPKIPCSLCGLCSQVNSGMWDSGHVPTVECIGHLGEEVCPYNSNPSSPVIYGDM